VQGLNETAAGLVAPNWLAKTFEEVVGRRQAEKALIESTLFSPTHAKEVGLVDVVCDRSDLEPIAIEYIENLEKLPRRARGLTKQMMRRELSDWMENNRDKDSENVKQILTDPEVQADLLAHMQKLKNKTRFF